MARIAIVCCLFAVLLMGLCFDVSQAQPQYPNGRQGGGGGRPGQGGGQQGQGGWQSGNQGGRPAGYPAGGGYPGGK